MDTLKILLGATVALLIGALAVAYKDGPAEKGASKDEVAELKAQIQQLQIEQDRLETERQKRILEEATAKAAAEKAAAPAPAAPAPAEVAALEEQLAKLEAEKAKAERNAETANNEAAYVAGHVLEQRDNEGRRARMVRDAMLIARVKEWVDDPQLGGFATIEILMPENVQPETVLCVRRNSGILGRLKVGEMSIEGAIATPMGAFPEAKPQPGDELILDPM
jgi:polyhydroxyalkanoate synthesis regulator phasin